MKFSAAQSCRVGVCNTKLLTQMNHLSPHSNLIADMARLTVSTALLTSASQRQPRGCSPITHASSASIHHCAATMAAADDTCAPLLLNPLANETNTGISAATAISLASLHMPAHPTLTKHHATHSLCSSSTYGCLMSFLPAQATQEGAQSPARGKCLAGCALQCVPPLYPLSAMLRCRPVKQAAHSSFLQYTTPANKVCKQRVQPATFC
jgi:hypothetical protein